jgi:hypothetical protein
MNYAEIEDKIGKRNLKKLTEIYRATVMEQVGQSRAKILDGVTAYLVEVKKVLGGGRIKIEKIIEEVAEGGFWDQVVVLTRYLSRSKKYGHV